MKSFTSGSILLIILTWFPAVAKADNWVFILQDDRGRVLYLDTDSASRKGDLVTIDIKYNGNGSKETVVVDCNRKLVAWGPHEGGTVSGLQRVGAKRVLAKACKRFWEFWK